MGMLIAKPDEIAFGKTELATEPPVHHNRQRVLIARSLRLSPVHFRGHIVGRTTHAVWGLNRGTPRFRNNGDAEITDQQFSLRTNESVIRFELSLDTAGMVGIL